MIKHDCEQGTREWLQLKAGVPSTSHFNEIITATGKPSKSAEGYMAQLIAESILGASEDQLASDWIERGIQLEPSAVSFYEFQNDCETEKVGFVTTDNGLIGCSPDRLVGDDGGLEIKCPSPKQHILYLLGGEGIGKAYKQQVQGSIWVCERDWWDTESYCPEIRPAVLRVGRDEEYIKLMEQLLRDFCEKLAEEREKIMEMVRERVPQAEAEIDDSDMPKAFQD